MAGRRPLCLSPLLPLLTLVPSSPAASGTAPIPEGTDAVPTASACEGEGGPAGDVPLKRAAAAWGPAALWASGLFLLSGISEPPPAFELLLLIPDTVAHFVLYLVLGGLVARARIRGGPRIPHAVLISAAAGYAAFDEWRQGLVPGRTPEPSDWLADVAGLLAGYLAVAFALGRRTVGPGGVEEG